MLLLLVTVQFLLPGCGGEGAISSGDGPKSFDNNLAVELAYLSLQAYQQLNDYRSNRTFVLPPPYILQEQFFTTMRFAGEEPGSGEGLPIGFAATAGEAIYVVFRGTQTAAEWINNVRVDQVAYPFIGNGGNSHRGFTEIYDTVHESIVGTVSSLLASAFYSTLYVTGHSLGGALAVLAGPELSEKTALRPTMYSFGSPRTGDPTFRQSYSERVAQSWRIINANDLVPTLPPEKTVIIVDGNQVKELAYVHVDSERIVRFGNPVETPGDLGQIASNHAMCHYYNVLCDGTVDPVACKMVAAGVKDCLP